MFGETERKSVSSTVCWLCLLRVFKCVSFSAAIKRFYLIKCNLYQFISRWDHKLSSYSALSLTLGSFSSMIAHIDGCIFTLWTGISYRMSSVSTVIQMRLVLDLSFAREQTICFVCERAGFFSSSATPYNGAEDAHVKIRAKFIYNIINADGIYGEWNRFCLTVFPNKSHKSTGNRP